MVKIGNIPWIVPNLEYTLDYTVTSQSAPQNVVDITTPSYPLRINLFAFQVGSTIPSNWVFQIVINQAPFAYPNGTNPFQHPTQTYTLCGNVPTDYIDIPANTRIQILAYMNGAASQNDTLQLTISAKQITYEKGD